MYFQILEQMMQIIKISFNLKINQGIQLINPTYEKIT